MPRVVTFLLALWLFPLIGACPLRGADKVWDGEGLDSFWQTGENWDPTGGGGNAPFPNDSLFFAGTVNTATINDFPTNTIFDSITFVSNSAAFLLDGNPLLLNSAWGSATAQNIGGSITNNSANNNQAVNLAVTLTTGKHLIANSRPGNLNFGGKLSREPGAVVQFYKTGSGQINIANGATNANDILGGWALFGTDWAALDASNNVMAYSGYTVIAGNATISNNPAANIRINTGSQTNILASPLTDINSLMFTNNGVATINIGTNTLRLGTLGGISRGSATSSGTLFFIGQANPSNGMLTAGGTNDASGEIVLDTGGAANNVTTITLHAQITDNGLGPVKLIKTGHASCQMSTSTSNRFSGGTFIAQGRLQAATLNAFGDGPVFVSSGGQAYLSAFTLFTNDFFISGIGTTEGGGFGALRISANTNAGTITLVGDARIVSSSPSSKIPGRITGNFNVEFGVVQVLNGTILLSNTNNDWGGNTTIVGRTNGGGPNIIKLGASEVIPNGIGKGDVLIRGSSQSANGGALDLNGFNETINGLGTLSPASSAFVTNSSTTAATVIVGDANASSVWGGNIESGTGVIHLTKTGTGTLTLTDTNSYTGDTFVNLGYLTLGALGSIANSANITVDVEAHLDVSGVSAGFAVGSGQALRGLGTVVGNVTVNGTISPGNVVGTIATDGEVWSGGGSYNWEINDAAGAQGGDPGWDLVNITGGLTITATVSNKFNIKINSLNGAMPGNAANFANTNDYTWTILKTTSGVINFDVTAFNVISSAFSNSVLAEGKFLVALANTNKDIVLKYVRLPAITSQPVGATVAAGASKTFMVSATGSPTLTYQWRKNGTDIVGAADSSYSLNPVLASNAGSYDVVAANGFGSVTSSVAVLNVNCPTITVNPSTLPEGLTGQAYTPSITASGGTAPYSFAVTAGAVPPGVGLASEGNFNGTPTLSGVFNITVTATDAFGCTGSRTYSLNINKTQTTSIQAGYNLIANQLDRANNTLNEIMPVVPDGSFVFKYDNEVGSYLGAALYSGATGSWQPGNIRLNPGEGAFFYCPTNFSLTFTGVAHVPVLPISVCKGYRLLSRQTNDVGTFENITGRSPAGGEGVFKWTGSNYSAYVYDVDLSAWQPSTPSVAVAESVWIYFPTGSDCAGSANGLTPPPVITTQPQGQLVAIGGNVTFSVVATGGGTITYQWRLNGINLPGATGSSLSITNVQPANSGDYTVVVANQGGATESKVAKLLLTIADGGLADYFTNRVTTNSSAGTVSGNNTNASKETGEPNHASNPGGKSVWYAWQAPANGIVTFNTKGSTFDTVLAIYRGTDVTALIPVTSDDDIGGYFASQVTFNVSAGTIYNIAIDGAYGASGNIILSWSFEETADVTPRIITEPQNQVAPAGSNVTVTVVATVSSGSLTYQWFFNGALILNATNSSYAISGLDSAEIGLYSVRVTAGGRNVFSRPALVQIADVQIGSSSVPPAQDKFLDTVIGGSSGGSLSVAGSARGKGRPLVATPAAGFTGTQIFNTYGSSKEPGEPNHCGEPGGASYWFSYQAPASGRLYIDTSNSAFNTVLAVYTGPTNLTSFTSLVSKACANVSGLGNEAVDFDATNSMMYYVVVDGVSGVTGIADLHYRLVTSPPVVSAHPQSQAVGSGSNATLTVSMAASATTLGYQWQFFSTNLSGATGSSYTRTGFQLTHQGNYRVIVTNMAGSATGGPAMLYLNTPAIRATNSSINSTGYFQTQWSGPTNGMLVLQTSTNLASSNWLSVRTNTLSNVGITTFTDTSAATLTNRLYRVMLLFP